MSCHADNKYVHRIKDIMLKSSPEFVLDIGVLVTIFLKLQVLYVGGGDESLQPVQSQLDPAHLTLLHCRKEIDEVAEIAPPTVLKGEIMRPHQSDKLTLSNTPINIVHIRVMLSNQL